MYADDYEPFIHVLNVQVVRSLQLPCWSQLAIRPISTEGDGDCLLHAVCIAIWGFHDRRVRLRTLLAEWMLAPGLVEVLKQIFVDFEKR